MKYSKVLAAIFFLTVLGFTGCQKYLEEVHPYQVTTDFLYNTPEGLQSAVNGLYSMERAQADDNESNDFALIQGDLGTDIDFMRAGTYPTVARYRLDGNLPTQVVIQGWWRKWYQIIERTNSIITYGKQATMSDSTRKMILSEAYIYRAYSYFWLVRKFDNIWLNLEPTTNENF
ncbi:MAG: RagB/SusD family nutrient uptake outer membrane protein [Bacteroidales bacterium]